MTSDKREVQHCKQLIDRPKFRASSSITRPRRVLPKSTENFTCLSWHEQNELKKALYASLKTDCVAVLNEDVDTISDCHLNAQLESSADPLTTVASDVKNWVSVAATSERLEHLPAQRKFATVVKLQQRRRPNGVSKIITTKKAKTEDFLTFLCLRVSTNDPKPLHSDFINASRDQHNNMTVESVDVPIDNTNATPCDDDAVIVKSHQRSIKPSMRGIESTAEENCSMRSEAVHSDDECLLAQYASSLDRVNSKKHKEDRTVSEKERTVHKTDKLVSKMDGRVHKTNCIVSDRDRRVYKRDKIVVKTDHRVLRPGKTVCETDRRVSKTNKTVCETGCRSPEENGALSSTEYRLLQTGKAACETDSRIPTTNMTVCETEGRLSGADRTTVCQTDRMVRERDCRGRQTDTIACQADCVVLQTGETVCETDMTVCDDSEESRHTSQKLCSFLASQKCVIGSGKSESAKANDKTTLDKNTVNGTLTENYDKCLQNSISKSRYHLADAPTYCPSDELFEEPISYIELLQSTVCNYGLCRILPPTGWRPRCELTDNTRFVTQLQYIHKLRNRRGSNVRRLSCLRTHLKQKGIKLDQVPLVGGIEVDLIALLDAVSCCGGLNHVISNDQWAAVAEMSNTVKCNKVDSTSRLCELYCRYLLSYDALDDAQKTLLKMDEEFDKNAANIDGYCFLKSKHRTVGEFATIAQNVTSTHFKTSPTPEQVEDLYWRYVDVQSHHVVVLSGELSQSAFPTQSSSPYSQHGWNFNILDQSKQCLVRQFCECSTVTQPSLNFAMLFTTRCWSRSVHLLPSLHYLHQGADIVWFSVSASQTDQFKEVVRKLVPTVGDIDNIVDSSRLMINPVELVANGITVSRLVQRCGDFIYVSPGCFTASIATGYSVSEKIDLATASWLPYGFEATSLFRSLSIPDAFSTSKLLCSIALSCAAVDGAVSANVVEYALPLMKSLFQREFELEASLIRLGLTASATGHDEHIRCDVCKMLCYLSMVVSEYDDVIYCLEHAVEFLIKKKEIETYKLFYQFTQDELQHMLATAERYLNIH